MTRIMWRAVVVAAATAFVSATAAVAQMGYSPPPAAQHAPSTQPHSETTTTGTGPHVRPEMAKPLQEAIKLQEAQDFAGAMAKIREADATADKTPGEEYVVAKFMGSVALHLNDHATAAQAFARAVASNAIPDNEKPNILYIAMALAAEQKNYAQAIQYGEMLTALGPLDEKASVALAQAYYNKGDYPNALKIASAALARGVTDPVSKAALLEVQTKGQAQSGNQSGAIASLEQQCAEVCDGQTWGQLANVTMGRVRGLTNHMALNILRLRFMAGGMDKDDYSTMATLDLQFGLPAEAQAVLQKGISSGAITRSGHIAEMLNRATTDAAREEHTLATFEREAAAKASGEEDVKLGETYFAHGMYGQAETALRRGLGKSGVHDRDDAQITLGIVLLAAGKKADAAAAFAAASGAQGPIAHLWTLYANRKG